MQLAKILRRFALVTALTLLATAGCKDKGGSTTPATSAESSSQAEGPRKGGDAIKAEAEPGTAGAAKNKPGQGWRWQGKDQRCFFLVGKECFDKREDACSSAGCPGSTCMVSDAIPARVSCKGAKQ